MVFVSRQQCFAFLMRLCVGNARSHCALEIGNTRRHSDSLTCMVLAVDWLEVPVDEASNILLNHS